MTAEQIAAQAKAFILIERAIEALVREQRTLYTAALAAGTDSPETDRWIMRGEQINAQVDRLKDSTIVLEGKLSAADSRAVRQLVRQAIPDQWYHVPNALPPEEDAAYRQRLTGTR